MTLEFKHFDTRLNTWIHVDGDSNNFESILTEKLENTLLEFYFSDQEFSFGHLDDYSSPEDLRNHPNGHTLLLSSKTRLLYGSPECLEVIDKLCPDRKDRGAYGSIFLGSCKNSINETLNILVVNDDSEQAKAGENGGIIKREDALKLVGDCYGQISTQLYNKLTKRKEQQDKSYRVIQHRFGWREGDGEDSKYRFGKGTLRPNNLSNVEYLDSNSKPKIDLILPLSSFKGTDKDRPGGAIKPQIQPGLYRQKIWLGEKSQSERGKTAISQLLASFPQGIKDFAEELEAQAQKLAESQSDPRKVAQLYCQKYEQRKAFTEEQKSSLKAEISEQVVDGLLAKQLELLTLNHAEEQFETSDDLDEKSEKDDLLMYKLIKADLIGGHNQLLETEKVRKELSKFVQGEWRDISLGRTLTFDRGMIIPSKDLKNGEICVPWLDDGEKVLNFRSPFLNSNGLCVSTNKIIDDCLASDGTRLEGIIVVNDEDIKRIKARLEQDETAPVETETQRQGRDFDGDCIGVALASKYPNFTAEAEYRILPANAYLPTIKEKKQSFYIDGKQPPFEEIANHMSDSISVGVINNQVTALEALESEIEILKLYGTPEQKSEYVDKVSHHYQKLLEAENYEHPKPIREEYKPYIQEFVALSQNPNRTSEVISQAMDKNRLMYRRMIEEACYQNQIAVDLFKSSKKPAMGLIKENNRYLYRQVDYIKDKKSPTAYLNLGIKTEGYSPVELLINQTNKYFQESKLESRPIVQFHDLFNGVEFTPQQRFAAIAAKYEFDRLHNAAVAMERRRDSERGPSAIIQTQQGSKLEITNLTYYDHPLIWKAQTINLKLEVDKRSSKLLTLAQINNELKDDGQPQYRKLGTVSPQSVEEYNLKPGTKANNASLVEIKPQLSRGQTKLMFQQTYQFAQAYRENIPEQERLSAAAAVWSVGAARQDELEDRQSQNKDPIYKKNPNFVFAAFGEEIISRLDQMQFTHLRVGTLSNEANSFKGKTWNQEEKYPIEIRASHHPPGHDRHALRLVFVQDTDGQYKEFAPLEPRTGQLPIGTKALANVLPGETYTASATISLTGTEPVEFTIREIKKFAHAPKTFHGESVTLEIGKVPVPTGVVKLKLDGKTLGELDADSIKQLQAVNYIKDGNPLNLKLTTISDKYNAFVIASSPNGNLIKIDKTNSYDHQGQKFNDTEYRRLTLDVPQSQIRDAVFLNGEPLGVLHFKKDKEALKQLGVFNFGRLTPVPATLQSNISTTMMVKIDPNTIEYPETWVKENFAFSQQITSEGQHREIERTAAILYQIKERPTILFATTEDKELGIIRMAVDNHKVDVVTKWLTDKNIAIAQQPPEDVPLETKKGLAVFNLVNSSIPEPVFEAMINKFGEVIESSEQYQEKLRSLPDRPKHLKPPQPVVSIVESPKVLRGANTVVSPVSPQNSQSTLHTSIKELVVISGKPIPMNFPLMLRGEPNPLPVDTCIDAMRGYGRVHTTRAYEPYRQYGFKEGDIALATGSGKQVAFRVGKQYQISQQMIADPQYQQQWAQMEKHSAKALPELFTGKPQVWGLNMEPLGNYVNGQIVPFEQQQNKAVPSQESQTITIDHLRSWYATANNLGKSEDYKQRIVQIANEFKVTGQLSPQAREAMEKDTVNRIAQIAHKIVSALGQCEEDGTTRVQGKIYDVSFHPEQRSWAIARSKGDVILRVQAGRVQINKLTPEFVQQFESANSKVDEVLETKKQVAGLQR
ncbi:hypothetical protein NIES2109_57170 (plasmid) [Nostoc sp. HK-01]|nr:hypothetical protein NIES2109_57170 [Nostoc sp. HK-01]